MQDRVKRINRGEMLMMFAFVASLRSSCGRKQVGAILAINGRVISTGYAGPPSGSNHCSSETCDLSKPCTRTIHAEANAILFAARHGIAIENSMLFCTDSPCMDCAKLIANSGIVSVYYNREYRDISALEYLHSLGIHTEKCELPSDYKL